MHARYTYLAFPIVRLAIITPTGHKSMRRIFRVINTRSRLLCKLTFVLSSYLRSVFDEVHQLLT
nr:hypothetical protein [Segatella maculosa]